MRTGKWYFLATIVILLSLVAGVKIALSAGITIDGNFSDWAGKPSFVDPGGVDDETAPGRADITEFRADSDGSGLYLLMAWDDTSFTGGQATTAGVTVRSGSNSYYRIYATASGSAVLASSLQIQSCTDATCGSQTLVCAGTACIGAQVASNTTWTDPFSHTTSGCSGTNCNTQDLAAEIFVPWSFIGGVPADGQYVFLQYGSYPSGPANAPKDDTGVNGLACRNTGGTFQCYSSTPTVLSLRDIDGLSVANNETSMPAVVSIVVIAAVGALALSLWHIGKGSNVSKT